MTGERSKYSPTLWEWLLPTALLLMGMMLMMVVMFASDTPRRDMAEMREPIPALLVGTVLGWGVAWWQRRRAWLSEGAGLAAGVCWILSVLWVDAYFRLRLKDETIMFIIFCGQVWVPWVLRQRVLLGAVLLLSLNLPLLFSNVLPDSALPMLGVAIAYGWWMLAERLRNHEGMYKGYGWVGVPACWLILFIALHLTMGTASLPLGSTPTVLTLAALMLLLRPRVGRKSWLVAAAAIVLPALVSVQLQEAQQVGGLFCSLERHAATPAAECFCWWLALPGPVAALWLAVTQRRREWVLCCTFTLFLWVTYCPALNHLMRDEINLILSASGAILVTLSIILYRKAAALPMPGAADRLPTDPVTPDQG